MNIVFVVTDLGLGGTQAFVEYAACELLRRGQRVAVIAERSPADRHDRLVAAGVTVYPFSEPKSLAEYAKLIEQFQADVIHLNVWERLPELVRLGRMSGVPLALTYHHVPNGSKGLLRIWLSRIIKPWVLKAYLARVYQARQFIDAFIGCGTTSAAAITRDLWPMRGMRVCAIRNAIPPRVIGQKRRVNREAVRFGQIGALELRKDPFCTLEAFATLRRDYAKVTLTFCGDGPLKSDLVSRAEELNLSCVYFSGSLVDTSSFYAECDVLVLPSWKEGLPYVLIEGAAWGIPLIASNVDGNPEIAVDQLNALLVPAGDVPALARAMTSLAESPKLRHQMGEAGRHLVEKEFGFDKQIDQLLALFGSLQLNSKQPAATAICRD